jgi:hypothetical protein
MDHLVVDEMQVWHGCFVAKTRSSPVMLRAGGKFIHLPGGQARLDDAATRSNGVAAAHAGRIPQIPFGLQVIICLSVVILIFLIVISVHDVRTRIRPGQR